MSESHANRFLSNAESCQTADGRAGKQLHQVSPNETAAWLTSAPPAPPSLREERNRRIHHVLPEVPVRLPVQKRQASKQLLSPPSGVNGGQTAGTEGFRDVAKRRRREQSRFSSCRQQQQPGIYDERL